MNFEDLVDRVTRRLAWPEAKATVREVLRAEFAIIGEALATESEVVLPELGRFKVEHVGSRTGRHPRTGEPIAIPERRRVKFAPTLRVKRGLQPVGGR